MPCGAHSSRLGSLDTMSLHPCVTTLPCHWPNTRPQLPPSQVWSPFTPMPRPSCHHTRSVSPDPYPHLLPGQASPFLIPFRLKCRFVGETLSSHPNPVFFPTPPSLEELPVTIATNHDEFCGLKPYNRAIFRKGQKSTRSFMGLNTRCRVAGFYCRV